MAFMQIDFFSEVLGMCTHMNVILPEDNKGAIGIEGTAQKDGWKVLYLLHGLSDDYTIWQRQTSIERYVSGKPIVVVMAETQRGWYTDMKYGFKWFTYFTEELPAIVKSFFPRVSTKREDTFVAGLSMGGYGAMKLALRLPSQYAAAASLSGALDVAELFCDKPGLSGDSEAENVFGDVKAIRGSENDLFTLARKVAEEAERPRLYMWCGTEDFLYWQNVRMRNLLKGLDYDLTYEESSGDHQWKYWDEKIQTVLKWLMPEGEGK